MKRFIFALILIASLSALAEDKKDKVITPEPPRTGVLRYVWKATPKKILTDATFPVRHPVKFSKRVKKVAW